MHKKADNLPKNSDGVMNSITASPAAEYRQVASSLFRSREGEGRGRAAAWTARQLGVTPRRVLAVLHGEVRRVWADEMDRARAVYRTWLHEEARRLDAQAGRLQAERDRLDLQDMQDAVPGRLPRVGRDGGA